MADLVTTVWRKEKPVSCGQHHEDGGHQAFFSEPRSCVKVEVDVQGSLSLISLMASVVVKQH